MLKTRAENTKDLHYEVDDLRGWLATLKMEVWGDLSFIYYVWLVWSKTGSAPLCQGASYSEFVESIRYGTAKYRVRGTSSATLCRSEPYGHREEISLLPTLLSAASSLYFTKPP